MRLRQLWANTGLRTALQVTFNLIADAAGLFPRWRYDEPMATAPRLEPDPFDKVVDDMLSDPTLLAALDEQHAKIEAGEAKLHSDDEVRARLRALGVPVRDHPDG